MSDQMEPVSPDALEITVLTPNVNSRESVLNSDGLVKPSYLSRVIVPSIVGSIVHSEDLITQGGRVDAVGDVPVMALYPKAEVWTKDRKVKAGELRHALTTISAEDLSTPKIVEVCMKLGVSPFIMPDSFLPDGPRRDQILQLIQPRRRQIALAAEALGFFYLDEKEESPVPFETEEQINQLVYFSISIWQQMKAAEQFAGQIRRQRTPSKVPLHLLRRNYLDWGALIDSEGNYYPRNPHDDNHRLVAGVLAFYNGTTLSTLERMRDSKLYSDPGRTFCGTHTSPGFISK